MRCYNSYVPAKKSSSKTKKDNSQRRLILLDMHAILHRAYHALPDFSTSKGEPSGALYGLAAMLLKIIADLKPDYIAAAYDLPKPTYRHEAYKDYKAGRAKTDDALIVQIERSRDVLKAFSIPSYEHEGFEADDVLGTIVEQTKGDASLEIVIATGDMDTLQLVDTQGRVKVFTLRKGMNDTVLYGHDDVVTRFGFGPEFLPDYKGLRGDPSDNIPGIKGIGEKTTSTLITHFGGIEAIYRQLESDSAVFDELKITPRIQGILKEGKDEAQFSKLLGTIRRDAPIAFAVPEKPWKETASATEITALFAELDFRSFGARLKTILGAVAGTETASLGFSAEEETKPKEPDITEDELKETKIALWLINSELTNPQPEDILSYARTESLKEAREKIFADLDSAGLRHVFEDIEKQLIPVISSMIGNGIKVDVSYLKELSETYHKELSDLEKKIWGHAGKEFNINSPRQLGDVLFIDLGLKGGKKTSTGQRSTKESELDKLIDTHPVIKEIIAYRELQKLLSTYIDAFPKMLDDTGRLHTTFIQTGAATGRMSSQAPNLQNIPIRTALGRAIRGAFMAERGNSLVTFDYSQIELRIAAILSRDPKLVKTFEDGGDIHTAVASEIFNVPVAEVTQDMRRSAKVINFGILYGMGANALSVTAGMTRSDAQKYLAEYESTFTGVSDYISRVRGEARTKGYTTTLFGRRRQLPGMRSPLPYIRAEAERQAVNAPVQGTSADIIKLAMSVIDRDIVSQDPENIRLVLQIHDELMYEVRDDLVDGVVPKIKAVMEGVVPKEKCAMPAGRQDGVPIIVDASVGRRWSEMRKLA